MCDDDDDKKKKERPFLSQRYCRRPFVSEPISRNFYFLLNWNAYVHSPFPPLSNRVRFFPFLFPFWWIEIKKKTYSINWIFMVHFLIIEMGTRKKKGMKLVCVRVNYSRVLEALFNALIVSAWFTNFLSCVSAHEKFITQRFRFRPSSQFNLSKKKKWDELCLLLKRKKKLILLIDFFSKFVVKMRRRMGTIVTFLNRYLIVCFVAGPRHLNDSNSSSFCRCTNYKLHPAYT